MRRRELIAAFGAVSLARAARAADATRMAVVGVLAPGPLQPVATFKLRLSELGWIEGRNMRFEDRWAGGDDSRYAELAAALVALPVDAILTWSTPAALAAKGATTKIPIVMGAIADPVGVGAVSGLARPGGNVTGFSSQNFELEEKRLELLHELIPGMARVVMLANAANPYSALAFKQVKNLAASLGVSCERLNIDEANGLESVLERLGRARPDGVLVPGVPALLLYRERITAFMAANRIPAVYPWPEFAEAGGLAVYSTNFDDLFRQAADYMDKILKGTPPGELPVQQATTFQLVINMRAAKALGLTVPMTLLGRADEVIE
jgi:putative tryptophan/tyrosine transport system substrate-binding protein